MKYNELVENSKSEDRLIEQRGHEYGVHHTLISANGELGSLLAAQLNLNADELESLIAIGALYLNHDRFLGSYRTEVKKGDYVRIHTSPRRYDMSKIDPRKILLFENHEFVVINKPAGLPVHALVDNNRENVISLFKDQYHLDLKVTTRLDIPTSGLIVYAKTADFQKRYNSYLRDDRIIKTYCAVAEALSLHPLPHQLIHYMEPSLKAPKKLNHEASPKSLRCDLLVLSAKQFVQKLVEFRIQLLTGRTHQIRAQLSYEGYPILGDEHYGSGYKARDGKDKIALQCQELRFPEGEFRLSDFTWEADFYKSLNGS